MRRSRLAAHYRTVDLLCVDERHFRTIRPLRTPPVTPSAYSHTTGSAFGSAGPGARRSHDRARVAGPGFAVMISMLAHATLHRRRVHETGLIRDRPDQRPA